MTSREYSSLILSSTSAHYDRLRPVVPELVVVRGSHAPVALAHVEERLTSSAKGSTTQIGVRRLAGTGLNNARKFARQGYALALHVKADALRTERLAAALIQGQNPTEG